MTALVACAGGLVAGVGVVSLSTFAILGRVGSQAYFPTK
jgi:hypothetical protein